MPWQPGGAGSSSVTSQLTSGTLLYSTNYQLNPAGSISVAGNAETSPQDVMSITGFFDGSPVIMELYIWALQLGNVANNQCTFNLWEDNSDVGRRARIFSVAAAINQFSIAKRWTHIPPIVANAATQHTYDIRAWGTGTSTLYVGVDGVAGASTPAEFNIYRAVPV
jgi:hypothetical protein